LARDPSNWGFASTIGPTGRFDTLLGPPGIQAVAFAARATWIPDEWPMAGCDLEIIRLAVALKPVEVVRVIPEYHSTDHWRFEPCCHGVLRCRGYRE